MFGDKCILLLAVLGFTLHGFYKSRQTIISIKPGLDAEVDTVRVRVSTSEDTTASISAGTAESDKSEDNAKSESKAKFERLTFVGRLANYKYFNMDQTVKNALELFDKDALPSHHLHSFVSLPSRDLVINHCQEDLSWINVWVHALNISRVFVYDKCGQPPAPRALMHTTRLPNVGREGHSWLYHLLRPHATFATHTLFVTGGHEVTLDAVKQRLMSERRGRRIDFIHPQFTRCYSWPCCASAIPIGTNKLSLLTAYFTNVTERPPTPRTRCTLRGEMLVSDDQIYTALRRHRHVLEHLYEALNHTNDAVEGHVLERLWGSLLSPSVIPTP